MAQQNKTETLREKVRRKSAELKEKAKSELKQLDTETIKELCDEAKQAKELYDKHGEGIMDFFKDAADMLG